MADFSQHELLQKVVHNALSIHAYPSPSRLMGVVLTVAFVGYIVKGSGV